MSFERFGISRRRFLSAPLAAWLGHRLSAIPARASVTPGRARQVVFLYMAGGPSQIDTFDPKPGSAVGGPFRAIGTSIPNVQFSEHLPRLAERARHLAVIRSMTSTEGSHARARYLLHTAYPPTASVRHPSIGAAVAQARPDPARALPAYVALGGPGEGAGFFGPEHAPFVVRSAPGQPIENLKLHGGLDESRLDARLELVRGFDRDFAAAGGADAVAAHQAMLTRGREMMRSPLVRAFSIDEEPEAVRKAYGAGPFGGRCLIARRLLDAGVAAVEIELNGWDTHQDNFTAHQKLLADVDPGVSALIDDLVARDRLDSTLIVWAGEFGRSPKINAKDGRDHHPRCFSAVLAGGGIKGGTVVGATSPDGDQVAARPVTVADLVATVLTTCGIDGQKTYTANERPLTLVNKGKPVTEVL